MSRQFLRRCLANRSRVATVGWAVVIYLIAPRAADLAGFRRAGVSREARLHKALAQKTALDFAECPLDEAVNDIARRHQIEVVLDRKALAEERIACDTPITCQVKGVSLRSAWRLMFGDLELAYVARDGYLLLTTEAEAEALLSVIAYPADDFVGADNSLCTPMQSSLRAAKVHSDYGHLIAMITSTIAPASWDDVGGPGVITEAVTSHAIAVRQSDAVHEAIAMVLDALRLVRDEQIAAAEAVVGAPPAEAAEHEMRLTAYWIMPFPLGLAAPPPPPPPIDTANDDARSWKRKRPDETTARISALVTELIEPESWHPRGAGIVRTVEDAILVRQTEDVHRQVAVLLTQAAPGRVVYWQRPNRPPPLTVDGPRRDWPARAEPLTKRDAAIERALDASAEIDVTAAPLVAVLNHLGAAHGVPMQIDSKALAAAGAPSDAPVTRQARGVTLRELLRTLLDEFDLTYVLRCEVLVVTTKDQADHLLATRVYPVFDLVCDARGKAESDSGQWQPILTLPYMGGVGNRRGRDRVARNYKSLIDGLTSCVAPTTWDEVGGAGSLCGFAPAGALVVSQTTQVHDEIAHYLKTLRAEAAE